MSDKHTFRYVNDWQRLDPDDGKAILAMWRRDTAMTGSHDVEERLAQVAAHVVDEQGRIAAVATVDPNLAPRLRQPMYFYRCFVARPYRDGKLVRPLLCYTREVLENYARANDYPCIGIIMELENPGFAASMRWANWPKSNLSFIGFSPRGLEVRASYFRGARLKTPQEMQRLMKQFQKKTH